MIKYFRPPPIERYRLYNNTAWWLLVIMFIIPDNGWPIYSQFLLKFTEVGVVLFITLYLYQSRLLVRNTGIVGVSYTLFVLLVNLNVGQGYIQGYLHGGHSSILGALKTVLLLSTFYPLLSVDNRIVDRFPILVLRLGCFHIIFSVLFYLTPWFKEVGKIDEFHIYGSMLNKTVVGPLFVWGIVTAIVYKPYRQWLWVTVLSVAVVLSYSKTAIYVLPLLLMLVLLQSPKKGFWPIVLVTVVASVLITFGESVVYGIFRGADVLENVTVLFGGGDRGDAHISAYIRAQTYVDSLKIVFAGIGDLSGWLGHGYFYMKSVFGAKTYTSDMTLVPLALDYGLIALFCFVAVYVVTIVRLYKCMRKTRDPVVETYLYMGIVLIPFLLTRNYVQYLVTSAVIMLFVAWLAFSLSALNKSTSSTVRDG